MGYLSLDVPEWVVERHECSESGDPLRRIDLNDMMKGRKWD